MACCSPSPSCIYMSVINYVHLPLSFALTFVAIVLNSLGNYYQVEMGTLSSLIVVCVVIFLGFVYAMFATCCGNWVAILIINIFYSIIALVMFFVGCYQFSFINKMWDIIEEYSFGDVLVDEDLDAAINRILGRAGCGDTLFIGCDVLVNKKANPIFYIAGFCDFFLGLILAVLSGVGYYMVFKYKDNLGQLGLAGPQSPADNFNANNNVNNNNNNNNNNHNNNNVVVIPGQAPYGQPQYGQAPYGQSQYGQAPPQQQYPPYPQNNSAPVYL